MNKKISSVQMVLGALSLLLISFNAQAVPSFARQTGIACAACHTVFPKLTPFGRQFKLNGYTMTGLKQIEAQEGKSAPGLKVSEIAPMSAMLQAGMTHVNNSGPGTENNHLALPGALSLYYAGAISPHTGAFIQVTMDDAMSNFGFDMGDLRYAKSITTKSGTPVTYGVTLDNMPGMDDLWNTTPAWTYPYLALSPNRGSSEPVVNTLMGAGLGAYAMIDNHWYGSLAFYDPMDPTIMPGVAKSDSPYWRFAWQGNVGKGGYLEVGTYGVMADVYGGGAPSDKFTDTALDAQYEVQLGDNRELDAHAVYIHEAQSLDVSNAGSPSQHIDQYRADIAYSIGHRYQYQLGYFSTSGSSGAFTWDGMSMGSPVGYGGDSSGIVAEFDYMPWENTKYSIQYTSYDKYDGASGGDSNTLLLNAWYMW